MTIKVLIFIFCIWLPVALAIDGILSLDDKPFYNKSRLYLSYLLRLPVIWFTQVNILVGKVLKKFSFSQKLSDWFRHSSRGNK